MAIYKLKDICLKIGSGATPKGGKEAYCDEGISLIRSQNVLDFTFSYDGLAHINDQQAEKLSNVEVKPQDILLNITGDSVARVCTVDPRALPARVNQHVAIIRPDENRVLSSVFSPNDKTIFASNCCWWCNKKCFDQKYDRKS